ncbi:MAG TPA: DUF523 and DUF1722 domain-containing protein, partial [Polyangia bacterium]|nr:DUF523 and DUF1722 domain-containing protein [Polyangia bacterium]
MPSRPAAAAAAAASASAPPLRVGVSACLLGREVRYDGQHKRDAFLVDQLGPFVEFVPVCPEVEVGMPIPRETLHLVRVEKDVRLRTTATREDWTARMNTFSRRRVKQLAGEGLSGYVFKKNSPSCGVWRVKTYGDGNPSAVERSGQGLFAAALTEAFPHLPVEEEGRLTDPRLRENFIERLFAYRRLQTLWEGPWTQGKLVAFHTAHKMALLAHDEPTYRKLGRLVAQGKDLARGELRAQYEAGFMGALTKLATPGRHANVLTHMLGHFSDQLDPPARQELLELIEDHRRGLVPLIVPLTLLRHHVKRLNVEYLAGQVYLDPHPKEL